MTRDQKNLLQEAKVELQNAELVYRAFVVNWMKTRDEARKPDIKTFTEWADKFKATIEKIDKQLAQKGSGT